MLGSSCAFLFYCCPSSQAVLCVLRFCVSPTFPLLELGSSSQWQFKSASRPKDGASDPTAKLVEYPRRHPVCRLLLCRMHAMLTGAPPVSAERGRQARERRQDTH